MPANLFSAPPCALSPGSGRHSLLVTLYSLFSKCPHAVCVHSFPQSSPLPCSVYKWHNRTALNWVVVYGVYRQRPPYLPTCPWTPGLTVRPELQFACEHRYPFNKQILILSKVFPKWDCYIVWWFYLFYFYFWNFCAVFHNGCTNLYFGPQFLRVHVLLCLC